MLEPTDQNIYTVYFLENSSEQRSQNETEVLNTHVSNIKLHIHLSSCWVHHILLRSTQLHAFSRVPREDPGLLSHIILQVVLFAAVPLRP